MSIYTTTTAARKPYVYIIQHKDTGIKYVGAKWATDANPDNFMQQNGYQTSSKTIKDILDSTPGVVFSILDVIEESELQTPFGCQTVYEYESWYMAENNCRESTDWYNKIGFHTLSHGSDEFKQIMMEKYGVSNCSELPWVRIKAENTTQGRYGYKYPLQDKIKLEEIKNTRLERTGYEHALQDPVSMSKFKNTNLLNLGVEYPMQSEVVKNKSKLKIQQKYGEQYTNITQVPSIKKKMDESSEKSYNEKYGVKSVSNIIWYCTQCDKNGKSLGNLGRWHKNHSGLFVEMHGKRVEYNDN